MDWKNLKIRNWNLLALFVIYLFVSFWLFLFTTGGWSGIFVLLYIGGAIVLLTLIMLIFSIFRSVKGVRYVYFNLLSLIPIIVIQFFAVLANPRDCGDAYGSFSFLQYMMNGFSVVGLCGNDAQYGQYGSGLMLFFLALYLSSIIVSFFFLTKPVSKSEEDENNSYLWMNILLGIIAVLFVVYTFYRVLTG